MAVQVSTSKWNSVYEQVVKLSERRHAFYGVWDGAGKVAWACRKLLAEYEGKTNRDEQFVSQIAITQEMAEAKVRQLDPEIIAIDAEIDKLMTFLREHEGVA